jgi:DNA-binding response OmpR family regulator
VPDVLLATDADWIHDEVDAALGDTDTTVRRVRTGREVLPLVMANPPALVILDLQIGNMGGMATCLEIRHEQSSGRLGTVPVLMLLDRTPDIFLARRSDPDGWLVKPIEAFTLRRAARALLDGGHFEDAVGESKSLEVP